MTCPTDMYELTIVVGVIMNYNYLQNYVLWALLVGHFTTWVNLQAHLQAHPTVLLERGFLDTEHLRKREIKSVRILLKIIHLASSSHIWSLCAEHHTLTKSKSRSIVSQITNLAYRKTYLVVISPNAYQKLTTSNIRSSWSRFKHCSKSLL